MLSRFLSLKAAAAAGAAVGELVDRPTLETCVCVAATALACVMAGTGDVETFRVLRGRARAWTRRRDDDDERRRPRRRRRRRRRRATGGSGGVSGLSFGAHAAIASAIGFLFLGGGTMTFSTDNASVAALWMATYPRFPQNASDNRCHLQAFRHLYALAARRRLLRAVDAAAGVDVTAPVEMRVRGDIDHRVVIARTPCLLPDPSVLVSVKVAGDRYWPVSVDAARGRARTPTRTLPVQRLAGALPYAADPTGARAGAAASLDVVRARAALEAPRGLRVKEANEAFDARPRASSGVARRRRARLFAAAGDDAAFGADPASAGFARLMCASVASETSDGNDVASQRRERAALASFCESALRGARAAKRRTPPRACGRLRRRARRLRRRGRGARP